MKEEIPPQLKAILEATFASVLRKCREHSTAVRSKSQRSQSEAEVSKRETHLYKGHAESVVRELISQLADSRAQKAATENALKQAELYQKSAEDTMKMAQFMHINRDIIANVMTRQGYAQGGVPLAGGINAPLPQVQRQAQIPQARRNPPRRGRQGGDPDDGGDDEEDEDDGGSDETCR